MCTLSSFDGNILATELGYLLLISMALELSLVEFYALSAFSPTPQGFLPNFLLYGYHYIRTAEIGPKTF